MSGGCRTPPRPPVPTPATPPTPPTGRWGTLPAVVLWIVVVVWNGSSGLAADGRLAIVQPAAGTSVFQHKPVVVRWLDEGGGDGAIDRVDVYLDGRRVAVGHEPPFRFMVDFGEHNVEHVLEAVAWRGDREVGRHRVELPKVTADAVVGLQLQQLYVTVSDRRGGRILDLTADAFRVRDDGAPQTLVTFAAGDIPFTALLLMDASDSMQGAPFTAALSGIRQFADMLQVHDEAKIVVAADRLLAQSPWSDDGDILLQGLAGLGAGGGSAVVDHLYASLAAVETRQGRRVVIVLSDGLDLHSVLTMEQVESIARRSRAMVFWLRLGEGPPRRTLSVDSASRAAAGGLHGVDLAPPRRVPRTSWRSREEVHAVARALEDLVAVTGGRVVTVESLEEIGAALTDVVDELRQQYALGYYPRPERRAGTWRAVQVRVEGPRSRQVRTRHGYVDR